MSPNQSLKVGADVIWRRVDTTVVAVQMADGQVFEMEGPAVEIWELLSAGRTRQEIASELSERYDVDPATLERDLSRTLDELEDAGLIDR